MTTKKELGRTCQGSIAGWGARGAETGLGRQRSSKTSSFPVAASFLSPHPAVRTFWASEPRIWGLFQGLGVVSAALLFQLPPAHTSPQKKKLCSKTVGKTKFTGRKNVLQPSQRGITRQSPNSRSASSLFSALWARCRASCIPAGVVAAGDSWELYLGSEASPHPSAAISLPSPAGDPWPGRCQRGKQFREAEINSFFPQVPPPSQSSWGCEVISQAPLAVHKCSHISLLVVNGEELKIGACYCFDELGLMQELRLQMLLGTLPFTSVVSQSTEMIIFPWQIENHSWGLHKSTFLQVIFYQICFPGICSSFPFWIH